MKKPLRAKLTPNLRAVVLLAFLSASIAVNAQSYNKGEYSQTTLGVNIGVPFFWGDLNSFASGKTYIGLMGGIQVGYQLSPVVGLGLTADYGQAKVGTMDYSKNFFLGNDGIAYPCPPLASTGITTKLYKDIYSKVEFFSAGLFADFNFNRIFFPSKDPNRWIVLAGPAIYMQQYTPRVYDKANDKQFTDNSGKAHDLSLSLGANLTLRYRASRTIDLQWKNSGLWLADTKFEGVSCGSKENANFAWYSTVGIVFKLNGKGKKDNLMYARRSEYVAPAVTPEPVKEEEPAVIIPVPAKEEPKPAPMPMVEPTPLVPTMSEVDYNNLPKLATVHFNRGSAEIDTDRYADELESILDEAERYPEAKIILGGYTDHVGDDTVNKVIGNQRIAAMRKYLVEHGIAEDRIELGYAGIDKNLSGKEAYSEQARRVELRLQKP